MSIKEKSICLLAAILFLYLIYLHSDTESKAERLMKISTLGLTDCEDKSVQIHGMCIDLREKRRMCL